MRCPTCKKNVSESEANCRHCGARVFGVQPFEGSPGIIPARAVPPALAGVMSFFVPGLGQIAVGQVGKGLLFLALIALGVFTAGISHFILVIYATAEAVTLARRHQGGLPISQWGTIWDPTWKP